MLRGRRTLLASVATAGMLAACGGEAASVTTDEQARQAIVDTFGDSWNAAMRIDVDITDAQLDAVFDAVAQADPAFDPQTMDGPAFLELLRAQAEAAESVAARGEDGSVRFGSVVDGETVLDVRLDVGQLVAAETLTPDATVLVKVDIPAFLDQFRQSFDLMGDMDPSMQGAIPPLPDLDQIRQSVSMFLPAGPVRDMVLAIVDGGFGGGTGTFDLAALGATQQDLDDFRSEMSFDEAPFDAADLVAALQDAVTIRDFTTADGLTTATVDVHPRAAVVAVGEMLEDVGELEDFRADFEAEMGTSVDDLPETLPGVATAGFDPDGHLQQLTVPFLDIARQLIEAHPDAPPELDAVMAQLDGARYDMVMTLSDVGQVPTVLDVDAVTVPWQDIVDTFKGLGAGADGMTSGTASVEAEPAT